MGWRIREKELLEKAAERSNKIVTINDKCIATNSIDGCSLYSMGSCRWEIPFHAVFQIIVSKPINNISLGKLQFALLCTFSCVLLKESIVKQDIFL